MFPFHYLILIVLPVVPLINAALSASGKACGTKTCSLNEFCSSISSQCDKCETICSEPSHNYDEKLCERQCQDYLHDTRYVLAYNFKDDISKLQQQQQANTVILVVILILLLAVCVIRVASWLRRKRLLSKCFLKKIAPVKTTTNTTNVPNDNLAPINIQIARGAADVVGSNILSTSGTDVSTVQTLTTPIHNRYPAENSTAEYSYDNAALQVTPSTEKPKGSETTF